MHNLNLSNSREKITLELIKGVEFVYKNKLFKEFGYQGIYTYCEQYLKVSPHDCYTFKGICERWDSVPEIKTALEAGTVTANKMGRILPAIEGNEETASFWIEQASRVSQRKLEKLVADAKPQLAKIRERAKPIGNNTRLVVITVTEEEYEEIQKAQDLHSNSQGEAVSLGKTVALCVKDSLKLRDPLQRAERARVRTEKKASRTEVGLLQATPSRLDAGQAQRQGDVGYQPKSSTCRKTGRYIPAASRHVVELRDQGACRHKHADGSICGSTRWTEIHHIIPFSMGGTHDPENLITLCSSHHTAIHEVSLTGQWHELRT